MKTPPNPYVGPRSIGLGEPLFGRDREVAELSDLLITERIVLFYSPSGAGKTSVIQAGLLPVMKDRGFTVRDIIRVNGERPAGGGNRFFASAFHTQPLDPAPRGELLIFDQFEELLTIDPADHAAKYEFMLRVGQALEAKGRWALFAMREDYLAACDPYLNLIPTRMSNHFRLDLLKEDAAMEAIRRPAGPGVEFTVEAAKALTHDLLETGLYVEPVQLQVVCRQLWEKLPEKTVRIVASDLTLLGSEIAAGLDGALAAYYSDEAAGIAKSTGVAERAIRDWFGRELITRQNTRGQVREGDEDSKAVEAALRPLVDSHLVRSGRRLGSTWYELAHDRLIAAVQASNRQWSEQFMHAVQRAAEIWVEQRRSKDSLLRGDALVDARQWQERNEPNEVERDFLAASEEAEAAHLRDLEKSERLQRQTRWLRWGSAGLAVVALLAAAAAWWAVQQRREAIEAGKSGRAALAEFDLDRFTRAWSADQPADALALLARALRTDPNSPRAGTLAAIALTQTSARLPLAELDHQEAVGYATFSRDSRRLLTTSAASRTRVWDVETGLPVGPAFEGGFDADLDDSGQLALVATSEGASGKVHLFDTGTGQSKEIAALAGVAAPRSVLFGPGGTMLIFGAGFRLLLEAGGRPVSPPLPPDLDQVRFSADGRRLLLWTQRSASTMTLPAGKSRLLTGADSIAAGAISPDGRFVALVSETSPAVIFEVSSGKPRSSTLTGGPFDLLGFTPGGAELLAGSKRAMTLYAVDNGMLLRTWVKAVDTDQLSFQSGTGAFTVVGDQFVDVRDAGTLRLRAQVYHRGTLDAWELSRDGRRLVSASGGRTFAEVWDVTPNPLPEAPLPGDPRPELPPPALLSFDRSRKLDLEKRLPEVREVKTDKLLATLSLAGNSEAPEKAKRVGALSRDNRFAAVGDSEGSGQLFEADTGRQVGSGFRHEAAINCMVFTPDGRFLITASNDRRARIWDVATGWLLTTIEHEGPVEKMAVSDDGRRLATATTAFLRDGKVYGWDLRLDAARWSEALADWAEALGGLRIPAGGVSGTQQVLSLAERRALLDKVAAQVRRDTRLAAAVERTRPGAKRPSP